MPFVFDGYCSNFYSEKIVHHHPYHSVLNNWNYLQQRTIKSMDWKVSFPRTWIECLFVRRWMHVEWWRSFLRMIPIEYNIDEEARRHDRLRYEGRNVYVKFYILRRGEREEKEEEKWINLLWKEEEVDWLLFVFVFTPFLFTRADHSIETVLNWRSMINSPSLPNKTIPQAKQSPMIEHYPISRLRLVHDVWK